MLKNFEITRDRRMIALDEAVARIMARYAARDCLSQKLSKRDEPCGKAEAENASEEKSPLVDHASAPRTYEKMGLLPCS
jgi:hypothetical protein